MTDVAPRRVKRVRAYSVTPEGAPTAEELELPEEVIVSRPFGTVVFGGLGGFGVKNSGAATFACVGCFVPVGSGLGIVTG